MKIQLPIEKAIWGLCLVGMAAIAPAALGQTQAGGIFIDASGPGAPVITSNSPLFISAPTNPQGTDHWGTTFVLFGTTAGRFAPQGFELLNPSTNAILDSFGFSSPLNAGSVTLLVADLYTADSFGNLSGRYSGCPGACTSAPSTGNFQLAFAGFTTSAGSVDFFLKGPVAAIPEPDAYALMLAGLGLLGWAARRRRQQAA